MFRNEYKPPLTLWIEKNHYNTESKEEDNLQGLFTLNEDEDMAGIQFFDENNGNQVNYGSSGSGSGNTNFNAHQLEGDADKFAKKGPSSNRPQSSSKYSRNGPDIDNLVNPNSNKYLQQFENDNLDYEKLGIIELEDDDFQDYYDI